MRSQLKRTDQKPSAPNLAKQIYPSHAHDCKISEDPTTSRSAEIPVFYEPFFFLVPAGISGHVKAAAITRSSGCAGQSRRATQQWSRRAPWSSSTSWLQDPSLIRSSAHAISSYLAILLEEQNGCHGRLTVGTPLLSFFPGDGRYS